MNGVALPASVRGFSPRYPRDLPNRLRNPPAPHPANLHNPFDSVLGRIADFSSSRNELPTCPRALAVLFVPRSRSTLILARRIAILTNALSLHLHLARCRNLFSIAISCARGRSYIAIKIDLTRHSRGLHPPFVCEPSKPFSFRDVTIARGKIKIAIRANSPNPPAATFLSKLK